MCLVNSKLFNGSICIKFSLSHYIICVRAVKALARLCGYTGTSEPSLLAYALTRTPYIGSEALGTAFSDLYTPASCLKNIVSRGM